MKGGPIGTVLVALCRKLRSQGDSSLRSLAKLDDRLLDDIGVTREEARDLDRRWEEWSKRSPKR